MTGARWGKCVRDLGIVLLVVVGEQSLCLLGWCRQNDSSHSCTKQRRSVSFHGGRLNAERSSGFPSFEYIRIGGNFEGFKRSSVGTPVLR